MYVWDTGGDDDIHYERSAEIRKSEGEKLFFQLYKLVIVCSSQDQNTLTTGKSMKLFFSIVNRHSRIGDLHLKSSSVKINPLELQYWGAVF